MDACRKPLGAGFSMLTSAFCALKMVDLPYFSFPVGIGSVFDFFSRVLVGPVHSITIISRFSDCR